MIPIQATHVSGVVISRIDGVDKILLLKRVKGGYWCHVAGETGWQTILRELKEETQIDDVELHKADFLEQFYEAKENRILVIPCFVLFCPPNQPVVLNEEHTEYRWCSLEEAKQLTPFANQHHLYDHVWQYYVDVESLTPYTLIEQNS
ncbi:NUDIX domain-containing protein [Vibrio parahaemolyticus]|uniref:NUDIX hydrolase n=1 Tax=Vibrio parahaemolyticus TaxID=670 RepID=UPI000401A971|nr:NUDIX domain-containing protein [Vibrio parahaemolyticus]EGQ9150759.1 NUDIX domain-containing protein [Vibrio parahaemolyticus]EGQ9888509.1 NUDIX domain-containing protein [Vibrio parahaemolyticus]EGR3397221.1 NUDIX domain-containing protein [Vibrio parahaemolyticus]EJB8527788.1 NUDIX domain-containing protein [Vibrio parahaemolyticus]EJE4156799.1 NUDIX domain-containing protein [Vibrio parahaemolyticus]